MTLNVGEESEKRLAYEGEEVGFVLEGKIAIVFDGVTCRAKKGEAFYVDGRKEHIIVNKNNGVSKIIWIATPSNF